MVMTLTKLELMDKVIGSIQFLIDNPEAQARRKIATDIAGNELLPTDPYATCWCALGRIAHDLQDTPGLTIPKASPDMDDYELALAIADTYHNMFFPLMKLGLSKTMFVQSNDAFRDAAGRQQGLIQLRDRLNHHRKGFAA